MHLVRYSTGDGRDGGPTLVAARDDDGTLRALPFPTMAAALQVRVDELRTACAEASNPLPAGGQVLAPVDGRTEVWASGVTYRRSRQARMEESNDADVYSRVYSADRPELFFKSVAWRVVTDGALIGVREDSELNVPEPELAVVANCFGEVVGYTVCNDVSSRSIEGENPLYLPQAKVYAGACALADGIRPAWEVPDATDLSITCTVRRDESVAWSAETSTAQLKRPPTELLSWLFRAEHHPQGVVLSTGTGIVPELDFTLHEGDVVEIEIAEVGRLRNVVARGAAAFA